VLAIATKFAGAWLGARSLGRDGALAVGVGMVPRGEVGIIVAGIGNTTGTIDDELFAVIVGMSILTTLVVPPILRRLMVARPETAPKAV
jgi:Kef-type K+ transport system membrane component KefB